MNENRDFLKEMEELRLETDEIRTALVSKTAHFNNLVFDNGIFKVIMVELKGIRKENKENQDKNEKKLEDIKMELKNEFLEKNLKIEQKIEENQEKNDKKLGEIKLELKKEILEQNLKIEQKIEKNQKKNDKKFEELKKDLLEQNQKMEEQLSDLKNEIRKQQENVDESEENSVDSENDAETAPNTPIREAVLGEWKMMGHGDFEAMANKFRWILRRFSENLKFELVDGKLRQSGGGYVNIIEGEYADGKKLLYVEEDHLKSSWPVDGSEDFSIQHEQLHFVSTWRGLTCKRIYEKI